MQKAAKKRFFTFSAERSEEGAKATMDCIVLSDLYAVEFTETMSEKLIKAGGAKVKCMWCFLELELIVLQIYHKMKKKQSIAETCSFVM